MQLPCALYITSLSQIALHFPTSHQTLCTLQSRTQTWLHQQTKAFSQKLNAETTILKNIDKICIGFYCMPLCKMLWYLMHIPLLQFLVQFGMHTISAIVQSCAFHNFISENLVNSLYRSINQQFFASL